jgi:large subunit ribosomal protein L6
MSRLGKLPINIPSGVDVKIEKNFIIVKGPKGQLTQEFNKYVKVELKDQAVLVSVEKPDNKNERAYWGLYRSLINNMVFGVSQGYEKKLEINGVGYKVASSGKKLTFSLGFSHTIDFPLPEGIVATVEANKITITGFDKQLVGEVAAKIRKLKKPEPYKGKGIKYADEIIIRKEGKTSAKGS